MTFAPRWSLLPVLSLAVLACGPAPAAKIVPTRLAIATEGTLTVELLTRGPLALGQNRVFYKVTKDGQPVTRAGLVQQPLMQMETMKHACPVQNPAQTPDAEGAFEGMLIFNMPSSEMDHWSLAVEVTLDQAAPVKVSLGELSVADSTMKKVVTRDGKKIVLTWGYPEAPHVGANEVVVTAHVAKDMMMMDFVTVDDLVFAMTTEMPSMGHGSSGNVSPTRGDDGLYRGTAVFSMAGDWVVHLDVIGSDVSLATFDFPLDL